MPYLRSRLVRRLATRILADHKPRLMYVANANCAFPLWPAASLDVSATHFGTAPESVDNGIYRPQVTQMNLGGRYNFTAYGRKSSLRVQIQNIPTTNEWTSQYTPGFFQWPAPRTVFAYITTDLQRYRKGLIA